MASIAESSVGSLPLAKLAQLQDQILQQGRVLPEADSNVRRDDQATKDNDDDGAANAIGQSVDQVIAESGNAYQTPTSSPKIDALKPPPPRLPSAKSAPPAEMDALINQSPSQEAFKEMTRANSFHGFEGGDTQPMESQVWQEWEKSMNHGHGSTVTPRKEKMLLQISPDGRVEYTYGTEGTGRTPRTCQEGESGFVDLAGEWQQELGQGSPEAGSVSDLGDLLDTQSPDEQLQLYEQMFRKPELPETPSLAGHKRRRSGEMLTSEPSTKKTPGFSQLFNFKAQKGDVMTGTQLFEQTQAQSSPVLEGPQSDPALTRPSPNIHQNLNVSPPTVMMSSPIHNRAPPATAGEPRERYTSMLESQERKRARLENDLGLTRQSDDMFDGFEEDEDPQRRKFMTKRLRRTASDHAVHELQKMHAHSKPSSRPATSSSPQKVGMIDLRTPATTKKDGGLYFDEVSDDGNVSDGEQHGEEDLPIVEDETVGDLLDDDNEPTDNDVYDEFGQTVLRSQGPGPDDDEDEDVPEERDDDGAPTVDVEQPEEEAPQQMMVRDSSQQNRVNSQRRSQTATQHSAIADSQPLRNEGQQAALPQQGNDGSPSCSYVPGSQYAGKTSQDQASLPARRTQGSMGPPALSTSKSQDGNQQAVPSSPPVAATNGAWINYTAEASLERRKMLQQFQPDHKSTEQPTEQEIPESDLPTTDHASSRPETAEDRPNTESNNALFSSARSHLSTTGPSHSQPAPSPSPLKVFASQQSKVSSQSPRTKAGVRRFADITGGVAAPVLSRGETLDDVDAVMSGVFDADDQRFLEATSTPPRPERERPAKKRRVGGMPTVRSSSPVVEMQERYAEQAVVQDAPADEQLAEEQGTLEVETGPEDREARALRNSPSKANEQRPASPVPESTPESVKLREQAGAKAASQLVSKRTARTAKPTKLSSTGRKAGSKLQNESKVQVEEATPQTKGKSKRVSRGRTAEVEEAIPRTKTTSRRASKINHVEKKTNSDVLEPTEAEGGTNEPEIEETVVEANGGWAESEPIQQDEQPRTVAPHRVFALFKGTFNMFYSATWLGASGAGGHRVRFDDGTTTVIDSHLVCRLELRLGDQIKVDFAGMKNKVWIVKGFGAGLPSSQAREALTDIYGHETVKVQAKSTRNSVSGPNAVTQGEGEILNVAIEVVYLTQSMWPNYSSREFQIGGGPAVASRLETPSAGVQTPVDNDTPASRSRRAAASSTKVTEKHGSLARDESTTGVKTPGAGLFHGMAFAVSYGQNENEKVNVTRLIQRNGGTVLDEGFESLFISPNLEEAEITNNPSKKSSATAAHLQLKPEHKSLTFVALIADKHSRRAKYIQALALGLPALSGRWIVDSLNTAKNATLSASLTPLPWAKYLLAAGESAYLNGAVRSRDITPYDAASARLEDIIAARPLLLNGDGVLIVASKKSKAVWERRKAFAFLTLALGAGSVKRVGDLQEVKTLLAKDGEAWKFVYVDGSVGEASGVLFAKVKGSGGNNKRKRDEGLTTKVDANAMSASDGSVRIVNDEFVVQSLILGALVD